MICDWRDKRMVRYVTSTLCNLVNMIDREDTVGDERFLPIFLEDVNHNSSNKNAVDITAFSCIGVMMSDRQLG